MPLSTSHSLLRVKKVAVPEQSCKTGASSVLPRSSRSAGGQSGLTRPRSPPRPARTCRPGTAPCRREAQPGRWRDGEPCSAEVEHRLGDGVLGLDGLGAGLEVADRKSTRLNSSHVAISY